MANSFSSAQSRDLLPSFSLLWSLCRLLSLPPPAQPLVEASATQDGQTGSDLVEVHLGTAAATAAAPAAYSKDDRGMG